MSGGVWGVGGGVCPGWKSALTRFKQILKPHETKNLLIKSRNGIMLKISMCKKQKGLETEHKRYKSDTKCGDENKFLGFMCLDYKYHGKN